VLLQEDSPAYRQESAYHLCGCTSQQAELWAVIEAIDMIPPEGWIHIDTDSMYVVQGVLGEWNLRKNKDLWDRLRHLLTTRDVEFTHIPRCSQPEAVVADKMAKEAMRRCDDAR
jgi:ribonuclease HI